MTDLKLEKIFVSPQTPCIYWIRGEDLPCSDVLIARAAEIWCGEKGKTPFRAEVLRPEFGKPRFAHEPDVHFSISHSGNCWIDDNACALEGAVVRDDAYLGGNAVIGEAVIICDKAMVIDEVKLGGMIKLCGRSKAYKDGIYVDKGVYKDIILDKRMSENKPPKAEETTQTPPARLKIECQFGERNFSNTFEF